MKKIGIAIILLLISLSASAQHYYYYYGNKIYFNQNEYIRNICIDTEAPFPQRKDFVDSLFKYATSVDRFSDFSYRFYIDSTQLSQFISIISQNTTLIKLNSPELTRGHSVFWAVRKILSKIKYDVPIKPILDSLGVPYISFQKEKYNPRRYTIFLENDSAEFYAQKLYESGMFFFAEPDFYSIAEADGVEDNPLYSYQWPILNENVNINVLPAWNITSGKNIRVAVIDVGVQLDHEDLVDNLEMGYDAVDEEFVELFAENGAPESIYDNHGTCCSGIIGAANNQTGCVGIAYNSSIIPVRTAYFHSYYPSGMLPPNPPDPQPVVELVFKNSWFIDALNHTCYEKNVDIISFSIVKSEPSEAIETKIAEVCSEGRGGKGIVMAVSSGNTQTQSFQNMDTLLYIAKQPDVIAVGSIAPCGQRVEKGNICSFSSTYNSCYGDSLDLVAPGLLIPTTDYKYSYANNVYDTAFAGTSAAAPHVAGVAALVLSVNPCLTREEVTYILESTCTKVRPDLYNYATNSNHPNGTWNIEVGHGLVNAYEAVLLAQQMGGYVFRGQTEIQSNTLWDSASLINDDLIIDSLATLTITDTLYIAGGSRIIVRPGGKLIVDGGTLTNACDGEIWEGIVVEGNVNQRQLASKQGSVILTNATIKNARNAISTRGSEEATKWDKTGGIVQATNTLFHNNRRSAEFLSYENHNSTNSVTDNVSYFTRCTFTIDDNNLFAANGTSFENHVSMWQVRGVKFRGCAFRNEVTGTTGSARGKAIYTEEAGFLVKQVCPRVLPQNPCICLPLGNDTVTRSTFEGFYHAVHATSTLGSYDVTVDNCDFSQNGAGVLLSAADNARVSFNDFTLNSNLFLYYALGLDNCTGYAVESNAFHRQTYSDLPIVFGAMVDNSGMAENKIRMNNFLNLSIGCYVSGQNSSTKKPGPGLQFECNEFTGCYTDIGVSNGTVRSAQGSSTAGADNDFVSTLNSSINLSSANNINYWYSIGTGHVPLNPSTGVTLNNHATANGCASSLCDEPGFRDGAAALAQYRQMGEELSALASEYESRGYGENTEADEEAAVLAEQMSALSSAMGDLSRTAIRAILSDSVVDMALLKEWYQTIPVSVAAYQLAEVYNGERNWSAAREVLSSIPARFMLDSVEADEYRNYLALQQLRENVEGNWYRQSEREIEELQGVAEHNNGRAARMAKDILCFFHGICYEDDLLLDMDGMAERGLGGHTQNGRTRCVPTTKTGTITLYPNPTHNTLTVESASPIREIAVYDMTGRAVMVETMCTSSQQRVVNTSSLHAGIYIVKVITDKGTKTAKFVKK